MVAKAYHINSNLYHYGGNNPVRYVAPDGRETTVLIIHANSGWEKLVNGSHVAIHFSNPGVSEIDNEFYELTNEGLYFSSDSLLYGLIN